MFEQLSLIGCGLMGGSFALALRQAGLVKRVVGYSTPLVSAEHARADGVIDHIAVSAAEAVAHADVVMIAVPVAASRSIFQAIAPALPDKALLMDVGSTKRDVLTAAHETLGEHIGQFVPCHPIAGKERAGSAKPDAALYQNRQVILTPTDHTDAQHLQTASALWTAIGASVRLLSADTHDTGLGAVSHLPHLLAFAYMTSLLDQPKSDDILSLGGPGFRDFSRIAGCEASIWRDILRGNRDEVLLLSRAFRGALDDFEHAMTQDDPALLEQMLERASTARIAWQMRS